MEDYRSQFTGPQIDESIGLLREAGLDKLQHFLGLYSDTGTVPSGHAQGDYCYVGSATGADEYLWNGTAWIIGERNVNLLENVRVFRPRGEWTDEMACRALDCVVNPSDGCAYIAVQDSTGIEPGTDSSRWMLFANAGKSIYQLAVDRGYVGTEDEFVAAYNAAVAAANAAAARAEEAADDAADDFFNVMPYLPEGSIYFSDAAAARSAVPSAERKSGLFITYKLQDGWHTEQFTGTSWSVVSTYWRPIVPDGSVTTAKIADAAVTRDKLSLGVDDLISKGYKLVAPYFAEPASAAPSVTLGEVFVFAKTPGEYTNYATQLAGGHIKITESDGLCVLYKSFESIAAKYWHKLPLAAGYVDDGAVTTAKIDAGAVTKAKLADAVQELIGLGYKLVSPFVVTRSSTVPSVTEGKVFVFASEVGEYAHFLDLGGQKLSVASTDGICVFSAEYAPMQVTRWKKTALGTGKGGVRYDIAQQLTAAQQLQARQNIGAPGKDGYYASLSAGYADKAADLDIQTSAMVRHEQTKAMETTGGDKDVKDGAGFVRVVKGTENGIAAAGAKIISLGFNLIPSGSGTLFTFRCVKGEWGVYGTSQKNNGYLFTDSQGNILVPSSVKQNGVNVPTHTDHGNTYYLPSQDGQCTVTFATSQTNPCAHICWSNGRDTKDNYEAYNASQVDLASAINAIGGTLRRVGYVFDEINLETKQSIRRIGYRLLKDLSWTMEAGPTPEEGEATNTFRAIVSGGVASSDTIKAGGAFAIKGLSGMTFSLDGTSLVCDSTIASVAGFVTALGSGAIEYELAVPVVVANTLNGQIAISDYGIIIFENTAGASVVDIDFDFDQKWSDFIKNLPDDLSTKDRVIAEALVNLNERLAGIETMIDRGFPSLKVDDLTIARALFTRIALGDAFAAKAGAPTGIPAGVLQFHRNTTDGSIYLSVGSESPSDWIKIK